MGQEIAIKPGQWYFRQVSGTGQDFGDSESVGRTQVFSLIRSNQEAVIVANTSATKLFDGFIAVDSDLYQVNTAIMVACSNLGTAGIQNVMI